MYPFVLMECCDSADCLIPDLDSHQVQELSHSLLPPDTIIRHPETPASIQSRRALPSIQWFCKMQDNVTGSFGVLMSEVLTSQPTFNFSYCSPNATVCNGTSCVLPGNNDNKVLSTILSTVLTIMLAMVMFSMGCNVELQKFLGHIKRPWGILVGFLCQFGIMPLTGFVLALAFNVLPIQAVAVIIMGCCPGGTASNILAYWVDGDMDLR